MTPWLFNPKNVDPAYLKPKRYSEKVFAYYTRSGRPSISAARELMNRWYAAYPLEHAKDVRNRMVRSDVGFASGFMELFLHATLSRLRATLVVHPDVGQGITKHPDFLVTLPTGYQFYLEAKVATCKTDEDQRALRLKNLLYDGLNDHFTAPSHDLGITVYQVGRDVAPAKRIAGSLMELCADPEQAISQHDVFEWRQNGWTVHVDMWLKAEGDRHQVSERPLCMVGLPGMFAKDVGDIRKAIKAKIDHHDQLGKPYVIAVAAESDVPDKNNIKHAVYGSPGVCVDRRTMEFHSDIAPDGIWTGKGVSKNDHLIGVMGLVNLWPTSLNDCDWCIYENPYIVHDGALRALGLPYKCRSDHKHLNHVDGPSVLDAHGLLEGWPYGEEAHVQIEP